MSDQIHKAKEGEPRCQKLVNDSLCPNAPHDDTDYCLAHGAALMKMNDNTIGVRNYRLNKFHAKVKRMGSSAFIIDLRDEIAIARMLLEATLNSVENANELILHTGAISQLISNIEKLVSSCMKVDERMNNVLDKNVLMHKAEQFIAIASNYIKDPDDLEKFADEILGTLKDLDE